jgi:hypothetical protein
VVSFTNLGLQKNEERESVLDSDLVLILNESSRFFHFQDIIQSQNSKAFKMLPSYSYSPQKLMDAFHALEAKEEESRNDNASEDTVARVDKTTTKHSNSITPPFVVAAVQLTAGGLPDHSVEGFWERAQEAVRIAVQDKGANLILLPELFIGPYFCQSQEACLQKLAMELPSDTTSNFLIARMQVLAKTYQVVLPISIYERKNNALYNSVVMIDADGTLLGTYRKSHIPDGTGYQEKF